MLSSRDPGVLGLYGFRNRADYSYSKMRMADSNAILVKRVWDYLSDAGLESIVLGVPQTYPVKPLKGHLVSEFSDTGNRQRIYLSGHFQTGSSQNCADYAFDVHDFRTHDKSRLLQQLIDLTEVQFKLVKHCVMTRDWDFLIHVNIGLDRIHHGFWHFHDPHHRLYQPNNPYQHAIRDYYKMLDSMAGELISLAGDDTNVLVVSDHGVKRMDGGICLNEWLWREGWLVLRTPPPEGQITRFEDLDVDWSRTKAWGSGGYYGRVFFNVAGREPRGAIPPEEYEVHRDQLGGALEAMTGPDAQPLATRLFKPQEIYSQTRNIPPDLLVYFGNLHWRAVGSIGHGQPYTLENDTGPDSANHAEMGLFVLYEAGRRGEGQVAAINSWTLRRRSSTDCV